MTTDKSLPPEDAKQVRGASSVPLDGKGFASKLPVFYLVCFVDPETKELSVFEQVIDSAANSFDTALRDLMTAGWSIEPTHVLWCHPDGVEDLSMAFAEVWWKRIQNDFALGRDTLPTFLERNLPALALRHWALTPQGKGSN